MARKKRNIQGDVNDFSFDKEKSLQTFNKVKTSIPQSVIDKFDIKPVGQLKMLGSSLSGFNEKSYEESLKRAYAWMNEENEKNDYEIILLSYYPQEFMGKSILVNYKVKAKVKNND